MLEGRLCRRLFGALLRSLCCERLWQVVLSTRIAVWFRCPWQWRQVLRARAWGFRAECTPCQHHVSAALDLWQSTRPILVPALGELGLNAPPVVTHDVALVSQQWSAGRARMAVVALRLGMEVARVGGFGA